MDCRVLRHLMLKSDGNLACDDSAGYRINLTEVSKSPAWDYKKFITSPIFAHVRNSFARGEMPWPGVCEHCDLFSRDGEPHDTLASHIVALQVEPTLACALRCPSCNRTRETKFRDANRYDLDPDVLSNLLRSIAANGVVLDDITYIGWGEPLDHPRFAELTRIARGHLPATRQSVHTNGNVDAASTIGDCALDKIVVSCDGATPESYAQYRRLGDFDLAVRFMQDVKRLRPDIHLEWKYILFAWNDSVEETDRAQEIADDLGVDSMLFVLTNSKGKSESYGPDTLHQLPLRRPRVQVSPAAAMQPVTTTGAIVDGRSFSNDRGDRIVVDKANWLRSGVLEVIGWAAGPDIGDVGDLTCAVDDSAPHPNVERQVRADVWDRYPELPREPYGFVFRLPGSHDDDGVTLTLSVAGRDPTPTLWHSVRVEASR